MFEPLDLKSRLGLVAFGNLLDFHFSVTCCFGLEATGATGTLICTGWFSGGVTALLVFRYKPNSTSLT